MFTVATPKTNPLYDRL